MYANKKANNKKKRTPEQTDILGLVRLLRQSQIKKLKFHVYLFGLMGARLGLSIAHDASLIAWLSRSLLSSLTKFIYISN
jgi:hypothetical protein